MSTHDIAGDFAKTAARAAGHAASKGAQVAVRAAMKGAQAAGRVVSDKVASEVDLRKETSMVLEVRRQLAGGNYSWLLSEHKTFYQYQLLDETGNIILEAELNGSKGKALLLFDRAGNEVARLDRKSSHTFIRLADGRSADIHTKLLGEYEVTCKNSTLDLALKTELNGVDVWLDGVRIARIENGFNGYRLPAARIRVVDASCVDLSFCCCLARMTWVSSYIEGEGGGD